MSMSETDGATIQGEMLNDGIVYEQTPNWLKFACPEGKGEGTDAEAG